MIKNKIKSFSYRLCAYFRMFWMKLKRKNHIRIGKNSMCAPSSEITDEGSLSIGENVAFLKGATLICRKKGAIEIGKNTTIGIDTYIVAHKFIHIGANVEIAQGVKIYDHDHDVKTKNQDSLFWRKYFLTGSVSIGNNCWIGSNTIILRGTSIGDNCIVAAGCVLKGTYPSNSIIIQKRETTIVERKGENDD